MRVYPQLQEDVDDQEYDVVSQKHLGHTECDNYARIGIRTSMNVAQACTCALTTHNEHMHSTIST